MIVVGINIAVLVAYTLYERIAGGNGYSIITLAFLITLHFVLCFILALFPFYPKGFALSAVAVLLIGFSTCCAVYSIH